MDKFVLFLLGLACVAILIADGGIGYQIGKNANEDTWSPREYVPPQGEIVVYPQGDPLYDEHYAKDVNPYNAQALEDQSQAKFIDALAKFIDAQTENVQWETQQSKTVTAGGLIFVLCVVGFFVWAILK